MGQIANAITSFDLSSTLSFLSTSPSKSCRPRARARDIIVPFSNVYRENILAKLANGMPAIIIPPDLLADWGTHWHAVAGAPNVSAAQAFNKKQGMDFGKVFDNVVGVALSTMLGGIQVVVPSSTALIPSQSDCVEVGPVRIVGGIRPQNYDVAYRPDGIRIAYDSKTLNDSKSIGKNWQNMINDLATEASTVHTRFPYAIVAFIVAVPETALSASQATALIRTLERLATREHVRDEAHLAETIAFVVWNPLTGVISNTIPPASSHIHLDNFSPTLYKRYNERYKGLPPHD